MRYNWRVALGWWLAAVFCLGCWVLLFWALGTLAGLG